MDLAQTAAAMPRGAPSPEAVPGRRDTPRSGARGRAPPSEERVPCHGTAPRRWPTEPHGVRAPGRPRPRGRAAARRAGAGLAALATAPRRVPLGDRRRADARSPPPVAPRGRPPAVAPRAPGRARRRDSPARRGCAVDHRGTGTRGRHQAPSPHRPVPAPQRAARWPRRRSARLALVDPSGCAGRGGRSLGTRGGAGGRPGTPHARGLTPRSGPVAHVSGPILDGIAAHRAILCKPAAPCGGPMDLRAR